MPGRINTVEPGLLTGRETQPKPPRGYLRLFFTRHHLMITDLSEPCKLCAAFSIQIHYSKFRPVVMNEDTKLDMSHVPCEHCKDADSDHSTPLCDFCRHLRLRHVFDFSRRCLPTISALSRNIKGINIRLRESTPWSIRCDLCRYWASIRPDQPEQRRQVQRPDN